jgi:hypothetical protein
MTIILKKGWIIFDDAEQEVVPLEVYLTENEAKKYNDQNPMPEDEAFSFQDLLSMLKSDNSYLFSEKMSEETVKWLSDCLNENNP